jgi:hypothetical protein
MKQLFAVNAAGELFRLVHAADGWTDFQRYGRETAGSKPVNADLLCITEEELPDWAIDCWAWTDTQLAADSFSGLPLPSDFTVPIDPRD